MKSTNWDISPKYDVLPDDHWAVAEDRGWRSEGDVDMGRRDAGFTQEEIDRTLDEMVQQGDVETRMVDRGDGEMEMMYRLTPKGQAKAQAADDRRRFLSRLGEQTA